MLGFIVLSLVAYIILYFVIKAAVKNAIIEATPSKDAVSQSNAASTFRTQNTFTSEDSEIPQIICSICGLKHDFDYPVCPGCGHKNYLAQKFRF